MYSKQWMIAGILSGLFSVVFGAFGAHALKEVLSEKAQAIYHTAVQYQMFHALALLGLGLWATQYPAMDTRFAGWAFLLGIVLFSGSLFVLALTDLKFLGAVTPLGGVSFLVGWIAFAFLAWKV